MAGAEWPARLGTTLLVVAIVVHVGIAARAFLDAPEPQGDFDRYYAIASGTGRPYVDYQVEHPIGTLIVFKLLALGAGRASFGHGVVTVNAIADFLIVCALFSFWGLPASAFYALVSIPIADLLFHRIDLWSMSAATLGVAAWRARKPSLSAAALAVGTSFKLWPLVLIFALWSSSSRRRAATVFVLIGGALATITFVLAGWGAILEVLTFRGATGWQIESTVGSLIHAMSSAPVRDESGAWRIGTLGRLTSIALFLIAAPICVWASARGFRTKRCGVAWLGAVATLLTLSALLSAQYVGWLIPGGALAWAEGNRRPAALAAAAACLTALFLADYDAVVAGVGLMPAVVVLRNVVLVAVAVDSLRSIARASLSEPDLEP